MSNAIDPRRLVSHEGDLEEAAREYAESKKADASRPKEKLYSRPDDEPLASTQDRSKTASGVSYAELAKNAQKQTVPVAACDSMHTENCPVDGWETSFQPYVGNGVIGVGIGVTKKEGDAVTTIAHARAQVGLQNEVVIDGDTPNADVELFDGGGIRATARHDGPRLDAHVGLFNADGSTGVNLGAGAQLHSGTVAAERASDGSGWDLTGSAGVSDDMSVGVKNGPDGTPLLCLELDASVVTLHGRFPLPQ